MRLLVVRQFSCTAVLIFNKYRHQLQPICHPSLPRAHPGILQVATTTELCVAMPTARGPRASTAAAHLAKLGEGNEEEGQAKPAALLAEWAKTRHKEASHLRSLAQNSQAGAWRDWTSRTDWARSPTMARAGGRRYIRAPHRTRCCTIMTAGRNCGAAGISPTSSAWAPVSTSRRHTGRTSQTRLCPREHSPDAQRVECLCRLVRSGR